jgi:hypothetical protein
LSRSVRRVSMACTMQEPRWRDADPDAGESRNRSGHQGAAMQSRGQVASSWGQRIRSRAEVAPSRSASANVRAAERRRTRGGGSRAFFPSETRRSGDVPTMEDRSHRPSSLAR